MRRIGSGREKDIVLVSCDEGLPDMFGLFLLRRVAG